MTDSQALTISNTGASPSFPQAGQLDWVSLARSTGTYSLEVVARLANAGVEVVTICVGNIICSGFAFPAEGQQELSSSLTNLKGTSSFSKVLWFGFGVKHIVRTLSESEQGASCVALCAALAAAYSSFWAAQVLRELCQLRGTPPTFSPSIHQWGSLVEVCAGALSKSSFAKYHVGFIRLLVLPSDPPRRSTSPHDLAKALAVLGDLSKGSAISATFIGGQDCAWLAAFAQCLLRLNVEIRDENDVVIYRSSSIGEETMAHVVFIRESSKAVQSYPFSLIQQTYFVSSGDKLLHERLGITDCPYRYPTQWSTVLSDTFCEWATFSRPPISTLFSDLVGHIAVNSRQYYSIPTSAKAGPSLPYPSWLLWGVRCLYHPRRTGVEFLFYARKMLPELVRCVPETYVATSDVATTLKCIADCVKGISKVCQCSRCDTEMIGSESRCQVSVAMTVVRLLLILAPVTIREDIPPSTSALKQLYNSTLVSSRNSRGGIFSCQGIALVLFMFSGRLPKRQEYIGLSAASVGGICVYYSLLKDIHLSPCDALDIEVIPGHIKHREHMYNFITDIDVAGPINPPRSWADNIAQVEIDLIVEETEETKALAASYRLGRHPDAYTWFGVKAVTDVVRIIIRNEICCFENCGAYFADMSANERWGLKAIHPTNTGDESITETEALANESAAEPIHQACWSLLTWQSVRTCGLKESMQLLEIEAWELDPALLLLETLRFCNVLTGTGIHKRHVLVQAADCTTCRVRLAFSIWMGMEATEHLSHISHPSSIIPDSKSKKISIKEHHGKKDKESSFLLVPGPKVRPKRSETY